MISDFWRLLLIAVVLLGLDGLYLNLNSASYLTTFAQIQKAPVQINYLGAALAYLALIIGAYVTTGLGSNINIPFIGRVLPNLQGQVKNARIYATAFLFFIAYLIFNATTIAVFKDYTWRMAIKDTAWGTLLGLIVGYITQLFM
jgi:uncharacterized membrane protein